MSINELIVKNENELTEKQVEFLNLHNNILTCGSVISNGLINLAINLKKMKDDKLYIEAGYSSFEDYAENACGLKRRQAYNYVQILDKLGMDFVHSNAQIGIAKLTLLSSLSEDERSVFVENSNIEDSSVSELKEKIKILQEQNELKNKSIEDKDKIIDKNNKALSKLNSNINNLKEELKVANSREVEIVERDSEDTLNRMKELEEELTCTKKEVVDLNNQKTSLFRQLELSSSKELLEFKLLFESTQQNIIKLKQLIENIPVDKKQGCTSALKKIGELLC